MGPASGKPTKVTQPENWSQFYLNNKTPDISSRGLAASQDVSDFTLSAVNLNVQNKPKRILLLVIGKVNI